MALVTDKFRIYAAESFRNTLTATNKVYMFVGRPKVWGSSDVPPTGEPIDSFEYARTTYQDSVAFKRVDFTVVRQHAERLCQPPLWECVC